MSAELGFLKLPWSDMRWAEAEISFEVVLGDRASGLIGGKAKVRWQFEDRDNAPTYQVETEFDSVTEMLEFLDLNYLKEKANA